MGDQRRVHGIQSANRREIPKTTTTTSITTKMYSSLTFLTSSLLMVTGAPGGHYRSAPPAPTKTIAELAIATPALSTLLVAVKAAGLVETLSGEGPSLSLLLLMMLSPRYLQMLSMVFLQTRMLSQLSSSAMLFLELLSRPEMFLKAPLLLQLQVEK